MSTFIFCLSMLIFATFFRRLGTWQLALLPLLAVFLFIGSSISQNQQIKKAFNMKEFIQTNSLFLGWIGVLIGTGISLQFFEVGQNSLVVGGFVINLALRIISEFAQYKDGQRIFHNTHYLILIGLLVLVYLQVGLMGLIPTIMVMIPFHLGIYAFITFIIGNFHPIRNKITSTTYILTHATVLISIIGNVEYGYLFLILIAQIYLSLIYFGSHKIKLYIQNTEQRNEKIKISAKEILAGRKVLDHKRFVQHIQGQWRRERGQNIRKKLTPASHEITFLLNTIVVAGMIAIYIFQVYKAEPNIRQQLIYWISIGLFFLNFIYIRKQSNNIHSIHKIFVFIIINFAIYTNIIYIFGVENLTTIALIGIIRNYLNGFVILQSKSILPKGLFKYQDYRYRIATNMGALCINIGLVLYSSLPGQLSFGLITFYLGSYLFLTYYNVKYVQKLEHAE